MTRAGRGVERALSELARLKTAEDVAAFFRAEGITGTWCVGSLCPVAKYIRSRVEIESVVVGMTTVVVSGTEYARMHVPEVVSQFVYHFDRGRWPDLIEERAVA